MVGRPRKIGRREPNGRLARTYVNPKRQVAEQPHRLAVASEYREWPEAESEFGRLMLKRQITPAQYEAGKAYAELAAQYRAALQAPPIHPIGLDLSRVGKGSSGGMPDDTARTIKRRYDGAFEACGKAGNKAQRAVKDHAVFEKRVPDDDMLKLLIRGLNELVAFFHIDERLQISHRQK